MTELKKSIKPLRRPDLKAKEIAETIEKNKGNISACARQLGLGRYSLYIRIRQEPTLKKALEQSRETMLDMAESVLYSKVLQGSTPELIFFLKTQGRNRGYVERQEITGRDGEAIKVDTHDDAAERLNSRIDSIAAAIEAGEAINADSANED